jgi:hypothetical protein
MEILPHIETTRQQTALHQIDAAIDHVYKFELACAITLAGAAETMMPDTDRPHAWQYWKNHPQYNEVDMNETINWLKHYIPPDEKYIFEREATLIIFRAMTKYAAVYEDAPANWERFLEWAVGKGYLHR